MKQTKTWSVFNNQYFLRDVTSNREDIPKGVYEVQSTPQGELFLSRLIDKFEFGFKVYGLNTPFVEKVIKTYNNTTGNLGVLLNGIKGTGKSVTAEILANKLELPIILVTVPFEGLNSFLNSIQQDIVVFIDEYEKIYQGTAKYDMDNEESGSSGSGALLSLMDGVLKSNHRKVFLLTTNQVWLNENMLNRPGRIRYLKHFGDLTKEQVKEILDDCLVEKQWESDIYDFIRPLKIITVDIIKSIVSEVNIFNESPEICCKDFNVEFRDETYKIIKVDGKKVPTVIQEEVNIKLVDNFISRVKANPKGAFLECASIYLRSLESNGDGTYKVYDYNVGDEKQAFKIKFEKTQGYHSVFAY